MGTAKIEEIEERSLAASGQMTLPILELDQERFWAVSSEVKTSRKLRTKIEAAIAAEREDVDES